MLDFQHLSRGLNGADQLQRYRERTGMVGRGRRIWTAEELEILRRLYPDYAAAKKALPGRTYYAIRAHARERGIASKRQVWKMSELQRLRQLVATDATTQEMQAVFPGRTRHQLKATLGRYGIRRKRRGFKPTGHDLLDAVRQRCHELNLTMVDLDAMARTRRYFTTQAWIARGAPSLRHVVKAAQVLGGRISVLWPE